MLLLGAGESGKSTILKQMKIIHEGEPLNHFASRHSIYTFASSCQRSSFFFFGKSGSYTREEREAFKEVIFANTIQSMHAIIDAMQEMQIELKDHSLVPAGMMIQSLPPQTGHEFLDPLIVSAIRQLWKDPGVKHCFARSQEYQLSHVFSPSL
jgi:guanine nucleotide-binding protein subunit alpha